MPLELIDNNRASPTKDSFRSASDKINDNFEYLEGLIADGATILSGSGAPSGGTGADGDFYLDTAVWRIYGPKASGSWGSGTSLVGPAGANGTNGTNGTNGVGVPTGGTTGQVLRKSGGTDYATEWATPSTAPTGSAGGDLTGTYPNPTVGSNKIGAGKLAATAAAILFGRTAAGAGAGEEITVRRMRLASNVLQPNGPLTAVTGNATTNLNLNVSDNFELTLTGNTTLTVSNDAATDGVTVVIWGQASGYTLTWFSGIIWAGGSPPTPPTVSGHAIAVSFKKLLSGGYFGVFTPDAY